MADTPDPRLVVLVHGAWHGAWCWAALQAELDRRGVPSVAIDLPGHGASPEPLGDLLADADAVARSLDAIAERSADPRGVVLVGHSYGGAVISQAAHDRSDVDHLMYVAAFALRADESVMGLLTSFEPRTVALGSATVPSADGRTMTLDVAGAAPALYGSCPPEAVAAAIPRLGPQPTATFGQATTGSALGATPSTYVVCTRDEAVHPDHQSEMAERCDHAITLDTDHSPFVSATTDLADAIEALARRAD